MLCIMLGSMLDLIQNTHNYVHYFYANSNSSSVQVRGLLYVCVYIIVLTNACSDGVVNIVAMLSLFNRSL